MNHHINQLDVVHARAPAHVVGNVRCAGHGLNAADQHELILAGTDDLGTERNCAHGGRADLVEGHGGGGDRQARANQDLTGNVLAAAALQHLAEHYFIDRFLVHTGALDRRIGGNNAELGCGYVAEGAAVSTDRGTGCGTDINVHLAVSPFLLLRR